MTVTSVDICNRALVMLGSRKKIKSLTQDSLEAQSLGQNYTILLDWCLGLVNWNFARKTAALTNLKTATLPGPWVATTSPSPPWLHEFALPSDYIRAQYLTNSDTASSAYLGEPQRFALGTDTITGTQQQVLLTNQSSGVLIYTSRVSDPTLWPWYFERIVVASLAVTANTTIVGDDRMLAYLTEAWKRYIQVGEESNRGEGLAISDTTPEWIQALGVAYPSRRPDSRLAHSQQGVPNDNRS